MRVGVGCVAAEPGDYGSVLFVVFECAERRDEREWNRGGETRRDAGLLYECAGWLREVRRERDTSGGVRLDLKPYISVS